MKRELVNRLVALLLSLLLTASGKGGNGGAVAAAAAPPSLFHRHAEELYWSVPPATDHVPAPPPLTSQAAVLYERTHQVVLYAQNADVPLYPASTTKLLTALLLVEHTRPEDILTASESAISVEPSAIYLLPGEQITARNALAALLLQSANDAANVIAEHISGSLEAFATLMNERARALGAENAYFRNPSGLHDPEHIVTARDLVKIASAVAERQEILEIMQYDDLWPLEREVEPRYLVNRDPLFGVYPDFYGGKIGWTEQANYTYCGLAARGKLDLVVCVLNAPDRESLAQDAINLLEWGFMHFDREVLVRAGESLGVLALPNGEGYTEVFVPRTVSRLVARGQEEGISRALRFYPDLSAPLPAGSEVGSYSLRLAEEELHLPLVTAEAIPLSPSFVHLNRWRFYAVSGLGALLLLRAFQLQVRRARRNRRRRQPLSHSALSS